MVESFFVPPHSDNWGIPMIKIKAIMILFLKQAKKFFTGKEKYLNQYNDPIIVGIEEKIL